jgi:hypothetical protein
LSAITASFSPRVSEASATSSRGFVLQLGEVEGERRALDVLQLCAQQGDGFRNALVQG